MIRKFITIAAFAFAAAFAAVAPAAADVGLRGPFVRGQEVRAYMPMFGGPGEAAASVEEAKRAGALPPPRTVYLDAVAAVNGSDCAPNRRYCGPSQAVLNWIAEHRARPAARPIPLREGYHPAPQRQQAAVPMHRPRVAKTHRPASAQAIRHHRPRAMPAVYAPAPAPQAAYGRPCVNGVKMIIYCN